MPILQRFTKHPSAIRAYNVDVENLSPNTIGVVTTAVTPAGMTVVSTTAVGARVTALISGGAAGITYKPETTTNISNGERLIVEYEIAVEDV